MENDTFNPKSTYHQHFCVPFDERARDAGIDFDIKDLIIFKWFVMLY